MLQNKNIRLLLGIIGTLILGYLLWNVRFIIYYFFAAAIIAFIARPLMRLLNEVKFKDFKILDDLKKMFGFLEEAYLHKDVSKIEKVHAVEKQIVYRKVYTSLLGRGKDNIVLFHLGMSAKHFYLASSPLLGVLL